MRGHRDEPSQNLPATRRPRDSLFVASEVTRGEVVHGEERSTANKRERATVISVDDELAAVLTRRLAICPNVISDAEPLPSAPLNSGVATHALDGPHCRGNSARDTGWYRKGGGAEENVTPHYFCHFFTTHLRDRTGDRGIVKYLRGDVADDIIDTYNHNSSKRVREVYEKNIYSLL